jgi:hypothetical protein
MYTKGLYLNVYTEVYGRQTLLENKERRKMDMEGGNYRRRVTVDVSTGGRRVIVITVELHDGEDVANIIEMLQTLQAELEV